MNKIQRSSNGHSILSTTVLALLTLTFWLGLPQRSLGQSQWTTNGNNIKNTNTGNVGVVTATPDMTVKLHVAGGVRVDSNISAEYQDLAEWVPSRQQLTAGTVVVLDTQHLNQVIAASRAYDTKVAGVISLQPGITLGEAGEGKLLVAMTVRARIKAEATRPPVRVGDLLVMSDVEGVAMKSAPLDFGGTPIHRPGTIIGKTLEPLEKNTGEILVLLSL